jgi:simple sugar transport system permease protein
MMMSSISYVAIIGAMFTIATPLMYGALGAICNERAGVLNLGIEGTMYAGAFVGFLAAERSGWLWLGVVAALAAGAAAGALMGLLTVTIGVNQHVAGIGTTLALVAACDYVNRVLYNTGSQARSPKFSRLFGGADIVGQYVPTYLVLLVVAPLLWWVLRATGAGMRLRAVGENPEAADVAGISVAATRYSALVAGGVLMAAGGAFLTLALLGSFTIDIVSGRGWVCIALVIFGRWGVWQTVAGALLFGLADALQLQLAITPEFSDVPNELMIAVPYLVVIVALVVWGRGIRYPGAYLRPYRRA